MTTARRTLALVAMFAAVIASCDEESTEPTLQEFSANLTGASERPTGVVTNGSGGAVFSFTGTGAITYSISVNNLSSLPNGAHIHGPAGVNGTAGIMVGLAPLSAIQSGVLVTGTITATDVPTISLDSLKTLLRNGNAYVNVHTANFPLGEIRGQVEIDN